MNYYVNENGRAVRCSDDSLMHYGVLGMKWGKRKAREYRDYATGSRESAQESREIAQEKFKKLSAKGKVEKAKKVAAKWNKYAEADEAAARKYDEKAKRVEAKHERLAGKETFKRVSNASAGKTVAQALVFGTYGAVKYNQARTRGASRGKAAVEALLYKAGNNATSGILSIAEPRMNDKGKK